MVISQRSAGTLYTINQIYLNKKQTRASEEEKSNVRGDRNMTERSVLSLDLKESTEGFFHREGQDNNPHQRHITLYQPVTGASSSSPFFLSSPLRQHQRQRMGAAGPGGLSCRSGPRAAPGSLAEWGVHTADSCCCWACSAQPPPLLCSLCCPLRCLLCDLLDGEQCGLLHDMLC